MNTSMNRYRTEFFVECPTNLKKIRYLLDIETPFKLMVEDILNEVDRLNSDYHEDIADSLFESFGGRQVLRANHHGVEIETIRSER